MKIFQKIIVFFLLFVSTTSFSQNIIGTWKFQSIKLIDDTLNLNKVNNEDYLSINDDGTFEYSIKSIPILASGTWKIDDDLLIFKSTNTSDTIRSHKFKLAKNQLILLENNVEYVLSLSEKVYKNEFSIVTLGRGFIGIMSLLIIAFLFSRNKKEIKWSLVFKGLLIQVFFAIAILKIPVIQATFEWLSSIFVVILGFTRDGSLFLFGNLIEDTTSFGYIFAFQVLPTIIFFSALTSVLFYYGLLQKIVRFFAKLMRKTLKLSGSESLAAIGNVFLGQTESPLLIKPYIERMTKSELLCLMSGGMATIAGGVLAAYIGFLGGTDPVQQLFFAKHLLAASVMSAPAAIIVAKIILPETEKVDDKMEISNTNLGNNILEAISIGTTQGIKLAVNVGAMLLVFIAFIAMINYLLGNFVGDFTGLNEYVNRITNGQFQNMSLEFILGYIFAPISWLMGVCKEDIVLIGQLLGEKTILNEFVAYISLGEMISANKFYEDKSIIIATYMLCGFANFASIGIQIGGIGAIAPKRMKDLSKLGILSLVAGTLACLFTAVIVGMII